MNGYTATNGPNRLGGSTSTPQQLGAVGRRTSQNSDIARTRSSGPFSASSLEMFAASLEAEADEVWAGDDSDPLASIEMEQVDTGMSRQGSAETAPASRRCVSSE